MSKPKHSPGPWSSGGIITNSKADGIAHIMHSDHWPSGTTEANADLIAAAPEMLEALKQHRYQVAMMYDKIAFAEHLIKIADAAIAKAEGRSE